MYETEQENIAQLRNTLTGVGLVGGTSSNPPISDNLEQMDRLLSALAQSISTLSDRLQPIIVQTPEPESIDNSPISTGSFVTERLASYNKSLVYMRNRIDILVNTIEL